MSTIISSQISDDEDARVNLDGETVELMIDIGMVCVFIALLVGMCVHVYFFSWMIYQKLTHDVHFGILPGINMVCFT